MQQASLHGLVFYLVDIDSLAVVSISMRIMLPFVGSPQMHRALLGLARGDPLLRAFHAMVQGVSDGVHERIQQILDDRFVQLRLFSLYNQLHFLIQTLGNGPGQGGEPGENLADGHHANAHDAFLKLAGDAAQFWAVDRNWPPWS